MSDDPEDMAFERFKRIVRAALETLDASSPRRDPACTCEICTHIRAMRELVGMGEPDPGPRAA